MPIATARGVKYTPLEFKLKSLDAAEVESYAHVLLPSYKAGEGARKILFLLDYVPTEDLKSGKLLSGHQGQLLEAVINRVSERMFLRKTERFSWLAATFNACRTMGKAKSFQNSAKAEFGKRAEFLVERYKPDVVVLFGLGPAQHFLGDEIAKSNGNLTNWLGVPVTKTVAGHECRMYATLSLNSLATGQGGESSLLGYLGRNLANAISDTHQFAIDAERISNHRSVLVDTIAKFEKLMDHLESLTTPVAVDTEATSLNRRVNRLLTVQLAKCPDIGYVIPMYHKDTPFLPDELKVIAKRLKRFFEGRNKNAYHIYTNATFDMNLMRSQLKIRHFANHVYDIQAGEFCFHPDTLIQTESGWMRIDAYIDLEDKPKLLSFDHKNGAFEYKDVILSSRHQTSEKMYEIEYDGGTLRVTGNHKVWSMTRNAYVRADEIYPGEEVAIPE